MLWWELLCCSGSISCVWRRSARWVSVVFYTGVISAAFVQRMYIMVFAHLSITSWYTFCSLRWGYYWEVFPYLCRSTHSECGLRSSLISRSICRMMGISEHFHKCTTQYKIIYQGDFCINVAFCFSPFGIHQHFSNHLSQAAARCVARNLTIHAILQVILKLSFRASAEHLLHLQNHSVLNHLQLR
jgi:hypothetical protein